VGRPDHLDDLDRRLVRIYARQRGGTTVTIDAMDEGRSLAKTVRLSVANAVGQSRANVVAKFDSRNQVLREAARFEEHVQGRLAAGAYADSTKSLTAGAGNRAGTFYSFAQEHPRTLFSLLRAAPAAAAEAVAKLRDRLAPWHESTGGEQMSLQSIIDELCPSSNSGRTNFESRLDSLGSLQVTMKRASCHADLHGGNVLVAENGDPLLIDFADAYTGPALLDPITLELAPALHPDSPFRYDDWPSIEQAGRYEHDEAWLVSCPYGDYVAACRVWRDDMSIGGRDRDAVLLGFALRQCGHPSARTDLLDALIDSTLNRLDSS
jgi:hypothetical protein